MRWQPQCEQREMQSFWHAIAIFADAFLSNKKQKQRMNRPSAEENVKKRLQKCRSKFNWSEFIQMSELSSRPLVDLTNGAEQQGKQVNAFNFIFHRRQTVVSIAVAQNGSSLAKSKQFVFSENSLNWISISCRCVVGTRIYSQCVLQFPNGKVDWEMDETAINNRREDEPKSDQFSSDHVIISFTTRSIHLSRVTVQLICRRCRGVYVFSSPPDDCFSSLNAQ